MSTNNYDEDDSKNMETNSLENFDNSWVLLPNKENDVYYVCFFLFIFYLKFFMILDAVNTPFYRTRQIFNLIFVFIHVSGRTCESIWKIQTTKWTLVGYSN